MLPIIRYVYFCIIIYFNFFNILNIKNMAMIVYYRLLAYLSGHTLAINIDYKILEN